MTTLHLALIDAAARPTDHARSRRRRRRLRLAGLFALDARKPLPAPDTSAPDGVRDALRRLAHRDREVLVLHDLEGDEVLEIAARIGLRVSAVHARLSRARRRLRARLEAEA